MTKSEVKRIAVQKKKCFYCHDKCECHIPDNKARITCGCPVHGVLTRAGMKLTLEELKKVFLNYSEIEEAVERVAMGVYRIRHPYRAGSSSHHGGPTASYEKFYVEEDNIEVSLDTGCCGSYDSDYITFPILYLYTDNWYELEEKKVVNELEKQKKLNQERDKKQAEEQELLERKRYEVLKEKYEPKKGKIKK